MIQEKQLKELFKYIEQNWDVCVSQVDKTDIKRIFGGVLCEDIMNDTLHEVKAEPEELKGNCSTFDGSRLVDQVQPELNPIEQAYERGEKIRMKEWPSDLWIMKHSKTEAIDELKNTYDVTNWAMKPHPEKWELYTEPTEQPESEMCESDAIDYILTNKLNWKKLGDNRMFAIGFARTGASFRVSFVEYNHTLSGTREVIINNIDLSEWQPVDTSIKQPAQPSSQGKLDNSFDKDRFEAMFRAVVASGKNEHWEEDINVAKWAIEQLDAYYALKEGGNNE